MVALATEVEGHATPEEVLLFLALESQAGIDVVFAEIHAEHEETRRGLKRISVRIVGGEVLLPGYNGSADKGRCPFAAPLILSVSKDASDDRR